MTTAALSRDVDRVVFMLVDELAARSYRPTALLPVIIRQGAHRRRTLLLPSVRDRIVQRAIHDQLSDAAEALFGDASYGYRPGRSTLDAITAVRVHLDQRPWVLDADIADFFNSVPIDVALNAVRGVSSDAIFALIEDQLRAPIFGEPGTRLNGLPLGGPLRPLVSNLVLHPLDVALATLGDVAHVRFGDDFVALAPTIEQARAAQALAARVLGRQGLALHPSKTRILDARTDPFAFLGQAIVPGARDLVRAHRARRTIYLTQHGTRVVARGDRLVIQAPDEAELAVLVDGLSAVVVLARCEFSGPALALLLSRGIDTTFLSGHGRTWGAMRTWRSTSPETVVRQAEVAADPDRSLDLAKAMIDGKIRNLRRQLQRIQTRQKPSEVDVALADQEIARRRVFAATSKDQLMGAEGWATRAHYAAMRAIFPAEWGFSGRTRRPPRDPINAMLSFASVLLTQEMVGACLEAGLLPEVGVLHSPRARRPNLALDLIEEFRPIVVEGLALSIVRRRVLSPSEFEVDGRTGGIRLAATGRAAFLREYERRLLTSFTPPGSGASITYRSALAGQAREFARCCSDATHSYAPVRLK